MIKTCLAVLLFPIFVGCASGPLPLNKPIIMRPGETKQVGTDGFEITLRSTTEDSGCFSSADCSLMTFNGSIAVRLGEKKNLIQLRAVIKPGQPVLLETDGYQFQLTGVKKVGGDIEATFIILGPKKGGVPKP